MPATGVEWIQVQDDALTLHVDGTLYSEEAIFRACYVFTDRCYLFLERKDSHHIVVRFRKRQADADLRRVIGEFGNELIDQRLRIDLGKETRGIRELIVTRAFADAEFNFAYSERCLINLLDESEQIAAMREIARDLASRENQMKFQ